MVAPRRPPVRRKRTGFELIGGRKPAGFRFGRCGDRRSGSKPVLGCHAGGGNSPSSRDDARSSAILCDFEPGGQCLSESWRSCQHLQKNDGPGDFQGHRRPCRGGAPVRRPTLGMPGLQGGRGALSPLPDTQDGGTYGPTASCHGGRGAFCPLPDTKDGGASGPTASSGGRGAIGPLPDSSGCLRGTTGSEFQKDSGPPTGWRHRLAKDGSRSTRRMPPTRAPAQRLRGTGGRPKYFLELFAGCAFLTAACYAAGLRCATPFDIKASRLYDLTRPACQQIVLRWIELGQIWCVHLGTPCSGFSVAQRGENNASSWLSRACAAFSLRVIKACKKHSVHWCIENPASSRLWSQPGFRTLACRKSVHSVLFHMCRFGAPWLKPTRILSSFCLARLSLRCAGCTRHMVLQGIVHLRNGRRSWLTAVAGCYPPSLCRSWAKGIAEVCPDSGLHHGAPLRFEKWDSQLRQCPGCSEFAGCDQPRLPRRFSLPFDLDCKRCWTNF